VSERPLVEVTVAAPVEAVWRALRDPAEIRGWFGWEYPGLDEEIRYIFEQEAQASEADRVIRWSNGDRFTLLARGDHTVVRVTRAAPADGGDWSGIYDDVDEGWVTFVQQLRLALERHPGQERRTLYLAGQARRPGAPLAELLGLGPVASIPQGHRYELTGAPGDALAGELWFRSGNLTGVTVDGYGDGLLVVAEHAAAARPPHGGGTVTITTYGLEEGSFERLRQRWTAWWDRHHAAPEEVGQG
jgi:hypothetical protein